MVSLGIVCEESTALRCNILGLALVETSAVHMTNVVPPASTPATMIPDIPLRVVVLLKYTIQNYSRE